MIKRILDALKGAPQKPQPSASLTSQEPFATIYELLFCDKPELFKPTGNQEPTLWQRALYEQDAPEPVVAIAEDKQQESRIRLLAYRWLAVHGVTPTSKEILGVVIEVGLEHGNDTLAAYADGSVRYINQHGKLAVFEGEPSNIGEHAKQLIAVSRSTVDAIGPWLDARRKPPGTGDIRLSFLVANGLYFGEGPFKLMQNEPLARPVVDAGLQLLQTCVQVIAAMPVTQAK